MVKKPLDPAKALERLTALCNASEQCSTDIRHKLSLWGISDHAAEQIITRLQESRLVDDPRFCRAYARDKMRYNRWGSFKIKAALSAKHLDAGIIDDAIDALDPDEYHDIAVKVLAAAAAQLDEPRSYTSKIKILKRGASRGFESRLIMSIINSGELWPDGN